MSKLMYINCSLFVNKLEIENVNLLFAVKAGDNLWLANQWRISAELWLNEKK